MSARNMHVLMQWPQKFQKGIEHYLNINIMILW